MIARVVRFPFVFAIRAWQVIFRPILPSVCRFTPSCSDYALEAIRRHGVLRGIRLATGRVFRCRPGSGFGDDPVP
ncbi:MAG: membrane protein insertion efficiency factor YidD [Planctomycetota bacterium]